MRTTIDDILKQNQNLLSTFSPKKEKKEESALDRLANEEQIEREEKTNHYLEKILESLKNNSLNKDDSKKSTADTLMGFTE